MNLAMAAVVMLAMVGGVWAADTQPATRPATISATVPVGELKAIRYQRTGGFAGTNDVIEITPAGAVVVQGKLMGNGKGQLTAEQKAKLLAAFADWPKGAKNLPSPPQLADGFVVKIRYGTVEVTVGDQNPQVQASFTAAKQLLEGIAQGVKGE